MKYDPDKHHRRSIRLREYDYSTTGAYFVTICAQGRACLFGEVRDGEMRLNDAGRMVSEGWLKLAGKLPGVALDEYMIMPNHAHGIMGLNEPDDDVDRRGEPRVRPPLKCEQKDRGEHKVQGEHKDSKNQGEHKVRPYGTDAGSVGRIVQAFKSMTTIAYIRGVSEHGWPPFEGRLWQRNYYERVIRDERELGAARKYILENPIKWHLDRENPANAQQTTNNP